MRQIALASEGNQTMSGDSNRPLRIAVIGPRGIPSNYSGVERIVEELFEYIAARGHDVTVYVRPGVIQDHLAIYKGIRLVRLPAPGGKNFETLSHSFLSTLHAICRGDVHDGHMPFDVISYHTIAPGLFSPIPRLARVSVVNHVHGLDWQREKWRGMGSRVLHRCERTMVKNVTRIVGVNKDIVAYFRENYGIDVPLLPNGVNRVNDNFKPDVDTLNRFGLKPGKYIVTVGRVVPEKRIHDTVTAFSNVPGDFKLVFVGEGKHSPEYVERVRAQAASDPRIVFTGLLTGDALETVFRSARLYVTSSELEGLPSSLLECMERRVPAIVSDIPPHRELMTNVKGYQWFFQVGDVDTLSRHLTEALANPEFSASIADGQRYFVREHYSWPVLAEATLELYRKVVTNTRLQLA